MTTQRVFVEEWGASPAVRLPEDVVLIAEFQHGTCVKMEAPPGEIVIRSVQPRYTLDDLLDGVTPETLRDTLQWEDDHPAPRGRGSSKADPDEKN